MPRTIWVRIAVSVDRLGQWSAAGASGLSDGETAAELAGDPCARVVFVEAMVPCPDWPEAIEGGSGLIPLVGEDLSPEWGMAGLAPAATACLPAALSVAHRLSETLFGAG